MTSGQQRRFIAGPVRSFLLAYLCSSVFICGSTFSQGVNPQSLYGRDTTQSVYVRDSAVAVEKFALAERMEHLKEWDKSADVYMEILRSYQDRVVPSQIDSENKIYQYTSVTPAVQERLAKWPEQGLAVYRARYEAEAAGLLDAANDDPAQLHKVFSIFFVTEAAKRAGIRMTDLYFERGEFAASAWIGDWLLTWHPTLDEERPKVLYRTALAYHLAGSDQPAQARLNELKEKFPQATGSVRGIEVTLAESLEKELAGARSKARDGAADSWPLVFGSSDRSRIPSATSFGGARLFGIDIEKPPMRVAQPAQLRDLDNMNKTHRLAGVMTGIFPVVDRGELFFQDNARVYAVSLESGTPLPGWAETYDGERNGRYTLSTTSFPTPRGHQQTLTITDDSVLAVMGQADYLAMQYSGGYGRRETTLVCLDRRSGKLRWLAAPARFPESAANLRNLDLLGSPLVVGDSVYVQARGGKGLQFEDAYVLAFDLSTGRYKWACYIASSNSASPWDGDIGTAMSQNVSHMAYSSGRLYAMTNLGALAAIDAYDGTIVWLNIYPREGAAQGRNFNAVNWRVRSAQSSAPTRPWSYNPVIVTQQKVFTLPSDGQFVHIYDAGSGIEIKRIKLSDYANCDTLLGVVDEKLVLCSDRQVYCLNWQAYDGTNPASTRDAVLWSQQPVKKAMPEDSIRGRGFVTADSVLIPTAWQLLRISLNGGKLVEAYPPATPGQWSEEEGPGNVLVSGDRLILAGPIGSGSMRISVYTDLNLAMSKLDSAVAAAPDDPAPRLRYAEIMFVAGKIELAVAKLDEAIALVTSGTGSRDVLTRDRVFNAALTFAQKLTKDNLKQNAELASGLFDRAAATAATASQKVNYRLNRAAFERQRGRPEEEVKLYQQILTDGELRAVPVADPGGDTTPVAALARRAIDDAIRRGGPSVYEPFEQAAAEMLAAATAAAQPEQLQAVAQVYPNSDAAPQALIAAAEIYERANDPRRATQVLRQVYFGYPTQADRAQVVEAMARCYLMMPGRIDVVIARLNQGAKLPSKPSLTRPLVLPDGRTIENMTFAQAAEALRKYREQASGRDLPDVALPPLPHKGAPFLPETPQSIIVGVTSLIAPEAAFARHDRVITFSPGVGLRVFEVGKTEPAFTCEQITQPPTDAAWIGTNLLVWSESEAALISGESGKRMWRTGMKDVPQLEVVAQGEAPAAAEPPDVAQQLRIQRGEIELPGGEGIILDGQQRIVIQRNQRAMIVNGRVRVLNQNGAFAAVQPFEPQPLPAVEQFQHVRPLTDRVIVGTTHGRMLALDLDNGKPMWQIRPSDRGATHLLASDDFIVTRVVDDGSNVQLVVFDTYSGQVLARRNFGMENNMAALPVNVALSPDGRLVVLLPTRPIVKDLFSPDGLDGIEADPARQPVEPNAPYTASTTPEHIQISGEHFYVLSDNGAQVRMFSLTDGRPPRVAGGSTFLTAERQSVPPVMFRVVGSTVFLGSSREMRYYEPGKRSWLSGIGTASAVRLRDLVVAKDHVVAVTEPAGRGARQPNQQTVAVNLSAFSRAVNATGSESGVFEYDHPITDASGIAAWQAVDGGFYYLGGDQRLHFLRGARQ